MQRELYRARRRPLKNFRAYIKFKLYNLAFNHSAYLSNKTKERIRSGFHKYDPLRSLVSASHSHRDIERILYYGAFRSDFYRLDQSKREAKQKTVSDYVRDNRMRSTMRKPIPGFHPRIYPGRHPFLGDGDAFADFLMRGMPEGPWLKTVLQGPSAAHPQSSCASVALHIHAYYANQLPEILERLRRNDARPDLFVSTSKAELDFVRRLFKSNYDGRVVDLRVFPNRGRNVGALVTGFGQDLLSSYEVIGHIHTKKSPHIQNRRVADEWSRFLLENLIGGSRGRNMMDYILGEMSFDKNLALVFPDDPYVYGWDKNFTGLRQSPHASV